MQTRPNRQCRLPPPSRRPFQLGGAEQRSRAPGPRRGIHGGGANPRHLFGCSRRKSDGGARLKRALREAHAPPPLP